ncbi:ATP-binding cassette domain-containing protein [Eubacteriaceae bacterium ES3]|nr:ATP-binding cassette domain-containing protein [Eubacteriaceae bacterium ES3]
MIQTDIQVRINELVFPDENKPALKNIKLDISQGEMIAITGSAASGKTLLLHTITSAAPKFFPCKIDGWVKIKGQDINELELNEMSDFVGYMMQEPQHQMLNRHIEDELSFGVSNMNLDPYEIKNRIAAIVDFLNMQNFTHRTTDSLSGGQAQKVVLGSVLAMRTPILLLDQPTAELDPKTSSELYSYLRKLNQENNLTIIIVMDRSDEILHGVDRVIVMEEGTIIDDLSPGQYKNKYTIKKTNNKKPLAIDTGTELISLKQVSHIYKSGIVGCDSIDFSLKKGEFTAIIGQNGSGKSTMLKLIEGLLKPSNGQVELFGQKITKKNIGPLRRRIGFLFQNPDDQIFLSSVRDEIGYILKSSTLSDAERQLKINDIIEFIGLKGLEDVHPQRLSRGQRQLLALGSVIVGDPELIIADEPTSGLSEAQGQVIMDKLSELSSKQISILLVTHNLVEAQNYSNRIVMMHNHRLVFDCEAENLMNYEKELIEYEILRGVL